MVLVKVGRSYSGYSESEGSAQQGLFLERVNLKET